MKKGIGWVLGLVDLFIGIIMLAIALTEIDNSPWYYTWRPPYTSYELGLIMLKWAGILFILSGVIWIVVKLFQSSYTSRHTQDINPLTQNGGTVKCTNCGLQIAANVKVCPRCGQSTGTYCGVAPQKREGAQFCEKCGNPVNPGASFCTKCGNRIN